VHLRDHQLVLPREKRESHKINGVASFSCWKSHIVSQVHRDAIARWQDEHGYPKTGFFTTTQYQALLSENAATDTNKSGQRRRGSHVRHARVIGGSFRMIGGLVGGLFRH
jgi:hypothetical protein